MTFGHPYFLLLLLLLPVLVLAERQAGQPPAFVYSSVQLVRGILNVTRTRSGAFLAALRWLILALLIIALAQPRLTQSETRSHRQRRGYRGRARHVRQHGLGGL